jgi:hypothetical protein
MCTCRIVFADSTGTSELHFYALVIQPTRKLKSSACVGTGMSESLSLSSALTCTTWAMANINGSWTNTTASMAPTTPGQMINMPTFPKTADIFPASDEAFTNMAELATAGRRSGEWATCQIRT